MLIPRELLDCVAFLCVEDSAGSILYGGTACYVNVPSEGNEELRFGYLLTARHCVKRALQRYGEIKLRVNLRSGGCRLITLPNKWVFSENEDSDIAALAWAPDPTVKLVSWPFVSFVTKEKLAAHGIGIGDDIFLLGLFTQRHGTKQNIPIIRTGVIASMPDEPIQDAQTGKDFKAYLAEMRSIGGMSGSPVFVFITSLNRLVRNRPPDTSWEILLLGFVRGHWEINQNSGIDLWTDEGAAINTGIALVTPIQDAIEVLMSQELKNDRRRQENEGRKKSAPVLDSMLDSTTVAPLDS